MFQSSVTSINLEDLKYFQTIRHENIIPLIESWERPSHFVVLCELAPKESILDFLRHTGHPRLCVLQSWSQQLLEALRFLHSRDPIIAHRNIHCANMFALNGRVRLGSLSHACVVTEGSQSASLGCST
jgi:serine/threonine protein kinase